MPLEDARRWMWPEACAMLARAERLHSQFFHIAAHSTRAADWEPPVDVLETGTQVVVVIGLPGVDPRTVDTTFDDGTLLVSGDRSQPAGLGRVFVHRMELPLGRFERRVTLPRGRYGDVQLATSNGCLIVTLSKVF